MKTNADSINNAHKNHFIISNKMGIFKANNAAYEKINLANTNNANDSYKNYLNATWVNMRARLIGMAFYELFDVVAAESKEQIEEAHRVRYQVFCIENKGFEDPAMHPDEMERDKYDEKSKHVLLIHRQSGKAVGAARVIFPDENNLTDCLPIQKVCKIPIMQNEEFIRNGFEISRLAIKREFQTDMIKTCRLKLKNYLSYDAKYNQGIFHKFLMSEGISIAPLGLIRGVFMQALLNGRLEGFGIMEPKHIRALQSAGLLMEIIGPEVSYHGTRVPFKINIKQIIDYANLYNKHSWEVVTKRGQLHELANKVSENLSANKTSLKSKGAA